jgi:hypothetical protein
MPNGSSSGERLARLETQIEHIHKVVDEIKSVQKEIHESLHQARGAAKLGKWVMPSATGIIGFASAWLGGMVHVPR